MRTALLVSIVVNAVLLAIDVSINPRQVRLSGIQAVAAALLTPAEAFVERVAPGHSGTQIVAGIVSSLAFYAVVTWLVLSLCAWWCDRLGRKTRGAS
jgi:hypothetical protein